MLASNRPIIGAGRRPNDKPMSISTRELKKTDNRFVNKRMMSMNKAIDSGSSDRVNKASNLLHLSRNASKKAIKPSIRKRNARDYA